MLRNVGRQVDVITACTDTEKMRKVLWQRFPFRSWFGDLRKRYSPFQQRPVAKGGGGGGKGKEGQYCYTPDYLERAFGDLW